MFKIKGGDGKEYGPVSDEVLRQWIAERRANAQTQVQTDGAVDFVALGQLPEFQTALAQAASATPPAPAPPRPAMPAVPGPIAGSGPRSSGMALASLIFGIVAFILLPFIAAIPAIIFGHIALTRIRRDPLGFGGRGQAVAGLVLGYVNLALIPFIAFVAGLTLPALAKAKGKAQRISCVNNLKQVALAARIYSNDHQETFPPSFVAMSNELVTPKILICPGDPSHQPAFDWSNFSETENVSYEYLSPGAKEGAGLAHQTVFRCPIHNNVALGDGSVSQLPQRGGR